MYQVYLYHTHEYMNAYVPFVTYVWCTCFIVLVVVVRVYSDHGVDDFMHLLVVYTYTQIDMLELIWGFDKRGTLPQNIAKKTDFRQRRRLLFPSSRLEIKICCVIRAPWDPSNHPDFFFFFPSVWRVEESDQQWGMSKYSFWHACARVYPFVSY